MDQGSQEFGASQWGQQEDKVGGPSLVAQVSLLDLFVVAVALP